MLLFLAMVVGALRAAVLFLLGSANGANGVSANGANGREFLRGLACGLIGGILAFCAVLVWHPLLVRGTGLVFVAMLALCHALHSRVEKREFEN